MAVNGKSPAPSRETLAAGGFFWGFLYLRSKSWLLAAVSHAAWDVAVFVLFPLG